MSEARSIRLPDDVQPRRYDVELAPDLGAAAFRGEVRVVVDVVRPVREIVLHAAELTIGRVLVERAGAPLPVAGHDVDDERELLVVSLADEVPAGELLLTISFEGTLNDRLRGFYLSSFRDADGVEHRIAASQMQATDCRRAFPCFDEPAFKAVFGITLVVDDGHLAISNEPEVERQPVGDGRVAVRFADTMRMSSYLVALVVGPLEVTDGGDVDGIPVRLVHVPAKGELAGFGIEVGSFALRWFQGYYGIAYPGRKLDLVAIPDFAAGAMENVGCVVFRESLLLVDPTSATRADRELLADVVCHEIAHMWFGDLVTMSWWNGIWLNEAFATFMEIAACDAFRPAWQKWTSFALERTAAFETDSLGSTRPVEFEVVTPADAEGMFDVITYQKGGSLLRMLQQYLGEESFRAGVRHYLERHAYGSTETSDLWDALEAVSGEPVRRMMDTWIWQPGFPLVSAALHGDRLVLRQERFGFDDDTVADPSRWVVPVQIREWSAGGVPDGTGGTVPGMPVRTSVLLDADSVHVTLQSADSVVLVNAGGHGFHRVRYDDELRRRLEGSLLHLDAVERYLLLDDTWAAVVGGRACAADVLRLVDAFADEDDLRVWQAIAGVVRSCARLLDGEALDALRARVRAVARPPLDRIGAQPRSDDDELTRQLRGLLVTLLGGLGEDAGIRAAARALDALFGSGDPVDPELLAAATSVVAQCGDAADHARFVERFRTATNPQDQLRHLYALAEFPDAELVAATCDLALSGEVRSQNAPFLLGRCIANPRHGALAWRRVRERWADVNERFPSSTIVRMVDSVKQLNDPAVAADVQAFFAEHPITQAAPTLAQILERQRVNVRLREREQQPLGGALLERR